MSEIFTQERVEKAYQAFYKSNVRYADDVKTIRDAVFNNLGVQIDENQAVIFWKWYSDSFCASWLYPSVPQEISKDFLDFLKFCESGGYPREDE